MQRGAWIFRTRNDCEHDYAELCRKGWRNSSEANMLEFVDCPWNMAANRQTKMIAAYDESFGPCYFIDNQPSQFSDNLLFVKAKRGLRKMTFFGLTEFQVYSERLFLRTFNGAFNFSHNNDQLENSLADQTLKMFDKSTIEEIKRVNRLDLKLYEYAKRLFFERMRFFNLTFNESSKLIL